MVFEDYVAIVSLALAVVSYVGYRWASNNVYLKYKPRVVTYKNGKGTDSPWHMKTMSLPAEERAKERSKTFPGFAKALAEQIGGDCK